MAHVVGAAAVSGNGQEDPEQLALRALKEALGDTRGLITMADIDGMLCVPSIRKPVTMMAHRIATRTGLLPRARRLVAETVDCGGATPCTLLARASQLVMQEHLGPVVVLGADCTKSMPTKDFLAAVETAGVSVASVHDMPSLADAAIPAIPAKYDEFAQWHTSQYGTTRQQLARVSVLMSHQAQGYPLAASTRVVSEEVVLASPTVAKLTNLHECARRSDGGGCLIVASAQWLKDKHRLPHPAQDARAWGRMVECVSWADAAGPIMPTVHQIGRECVPSFVAMQEAMRRSNVTVRDIEHFTLYDCFPVAFIVAVEDVGLADLGHGGQWVDAALDRVTQGYQVPVNTHGGLLGCGAPWECAVFFGIVESVMQLRGECGTRQVQPVPRWGLVQGNGGTFSASSVCVLRGGARHTSSNTPAASKL